mmetsp:Transcript_23621/g.57338  ORF Transcript_23621/g.57338 Transcript_23621/m.57338 type:complete len:299 (-) Transcript_23621:1300-2196(-)
MSGLLDAPMHTTFFRAPTPSISVRIWFTIRSPASPLEPPPPRGLAIESISSKKRMQGAAPRALAKRSRTLLSDSPIHMLRSSGPLTEMKFVLASFAMALAIRVLPHPEGPYSKTPLEGFMPNFSYLCAYSTGYMTVSISSCLTFSRPPTSAHVTSGISTLVSLREEGLVLAMAANMSFCLTRILRIWDMGSSSSSRSSRSVWSLMHCTPASSTSCARSPPVYPWASCAMPLRSTSSASCMFRVLILSISCLPLSSGDTTSISFEKRPKRRSDWSMSLGLLVAATTMTFSLMPSIRVMS